MAKLKLTLGGKLVGSQRWSVGFSFGPPDAAPSPSALSALATQLFTDFNTSAWSATATAATPLRGIAGIGSTLDQARIYYYPGSSTVAAVIGQSSNAAVAGINSITQAPQTALVCSLLTGFAGRNNRGRIYLPALALSVGTTTGLMNGPDVQKVAVSVANFLSLAQTRSLGGATLLPIVGSPTAPPTAISAVRVDNVLDTQRRRRDNVVPDITGLATVIAG